MHMGLNYANISLEDSPNTVLHDTCHNGPPNATHATHIPSRRREIVRPALLSIPVAKNIA
jgi:hypothetical protein